jgi:glycerophosphoryl diester phosphodiesterase
MAEYTPNLNLYKPNRQDNDIDVDTSLSENFDKIDTKIQENHDEINERLAGLKVADLESPVYLAHRGAKNIFPENSMEAFKGCVNMGLDVIEMDVRMLIDGTLGCMHNDSMDATTNKTGSLAYITTMGFKSAKVDSLPGWSGETALFEDLLRLFGNKVIYAPEIKEYGVGLDKALVDTIIKHKLQDNCIIQSFSAPELVYAIENDLDVLYLKAVDDVTPAQVQNWGINKIGFNKDTIPDHVVTDFVNAGLQVFMYTVNRRWEHDKYLAMGVHGFFSDDPMWISRKSPVTEWDVFRDQVFSHGMFQPPVDDGNVLGGHRGGFYDDNRFGWKYSSDKRDFCLQGWAGELPARFQLDYKATITDAAGSVRWGSVAFCTPNDYFDDINDSGALSNGYHLLVRESGSIDLYIRTGGSSTQLHSMATSPIPEGQFANMRVEVSDGTIKVTRVDTGHTFSVANSSMRGGYLHFGRNLAGCTFESVHVTNQT